MKRKYWASFGAVLTIGVSVLFFQNATVAGSTFDCTRFPVYFNIFMPSGLFGYSCRGPVQDLNIVEADIKKFHAKGKAVVCNYYLPRMGAAKELWCPEAPGGQVMSQYSGREGTPFSDLYRAMSLGSATLSTGFFASCIGTSMASGSKVVDPESPQPVTVTVRYVCQYKGGTKGAPSTATNTHPKIKAIMETPRAGGTFTSTDGSSHRVSDLRLVCSVASGETVCISSVQVTKIQ